MEIMGPSSLKGFGHMGRIRKEYSSQIHAWKIEVKGEMTHGLSVKAKIMVFLG